MKKTVVSVGELNQKIFIEEPSSDVDDLNQLTGKWKTVCAVYAKVIPVRGREFFEASRLQNETTYRFTIRYRPDIAATHRIVWLGKRYEIISEPMLLDGMRAWMEILASSGIRNAI